MPIDPRVKQYMMQYGYKDLTNFPEPSAMLNHRKWKNPGLSVAHGALSAIEQIALAGIKKKAEGNNLKAEKQTQEKISMEDQMAFKAKVDQLRQNGFEDLATAAEITGELPNNAAITKAMADRQKQQEDRQTEQTTMSPIQLAQQAGQLNMPADKTPMLSKDFRNPMGGDLPAGPQSARPEELLAMAQENVGKAAQLGKSLQTDFGGDLLSAINKWSEPDRRKELDNELLGVWGRYSNGDIGLEEAQAESIRIKNIMSGTSTMTEEDRMKWKGFVDEKGAVRSQENFDRQQGVQQASQITSYYNAAEGQYKMARARYEKELAKWNRYPAAYRAKHSAAAPKEPEPLPPFEQYIEKFKKNLRYGYDHLQSISEAEDPNALSDDDLKGLTPQEAADLSDEDFNRWMNLSGDE